MKGTKLRKLSVNEADRAVLMIQEEIGRSDDSRYDHRLHGVLLVAKGRDCYDVAELLGHSPTTIESWIHLFNDRGFEGLHDEIRSGRPSRIPDNIIEEINRDLRINPRDFGYPQNLWDGKLLSYHLKEKYSLSIGVRQAQRLFHKLGFRQRKPRPVISRGDPVAQESFKKTH
jgi:transposase